MGKVMKDEQTRIATEAVDEQVNYWPFPNKLLGTQPLNKLPFNPDNEEDAPL
jgi:hypothetical protein